MAGKIIPLVPKRLFSFDSLELSVPFTTILAEHIDISQYCEGFLLTRVHSANMAGGYMTLELHPDGYTPQDPTRSFQTDLQYFSATTYIDHTSAPGMLLAYGGAEGCFLGQYALLQLAVTRMSPGPVTAALSVDLLLRTPDDVDGEVYRAVQKAGGCGCNDVEMPEEWE